MEAGEQGVVVMRILKTFGSFAVDDIDLATRFYRDTVGLEVSAETEGASLWLHGSNAHDTLVYRKPGHVPAAFTVLNLFVDNLDEAVEELRGKGVAFERYEGIDTDERGIFHGTGHSVAWFTDPAGNVMAVGHQQSSASSGTAQGSARTTGPPEAVQPEHDAPAREDV